MFYSSLQAAISHSIYSNVNLKVKQVICLEAIYHGRDVVAVLPTGYGKSVIFHLLPSLFLDKINYERGAAAHPVVIVVSPLNALIKDQIRRLQEGNVNAAILNVRKKANSEDLEFDLSDANLSQLRDAKYEVIFTHPEAFITCKQGMELFQTAKYQRKVHAIVIDEAHCILEWGEDFRRDYSQLSMLCATFPQVPVVALTATASKADIKEIKDSLNMKNPLEVIGNPNRANIFYEKVFRKGNDIDFFQELLRPISLWQLGKEQYYPFGAEALPENRLFAQYHAPQTTAMKDQILKELASPASKVRIVFATVAMGMGVDIPSLRCVIHVGPPRTIREYFQETGGQVEMGSLQLQYYTTTIMTLLKIERE
ncbi:ATP-dependent DNA helicase RecQ-like [Acropora millepora]|uniref:ATP-dependent DNA helicase RecQ-like n=1 Tax=Acropora millepora TaxID=45264 RepID=UPI001CF2A976|nr:ATP-dependent DNA helicase RecQ-like [Acropora millepora]